MATWLPNGFEFLSGLPERKRKRRLLLSLQAFFDDSGTKGTGRVFVLGGLIGPAATMASLADDWDKECRNSYPGRICYFKSDEARDLSGEFNYWSPENRDLKVRRLAKVIDRPGLTVLFVPVDVQAHAQMERFSNLRKVAGVKIDPIKHPYVLAFHVLMFCLGAEVIRQKTTEKIEIFFDEQKVLKAELNNQYPVLMEIFEKRNKQLRSQFPNDLYFRDDKDYLPLQAADLIASDIRMTAEKDRKWTPVTSFGFKDLKMSPYCHALTETRLMHIMEIWTGAKFKLTPRASGASAPVSRQQRRAAERQSLKRSKRAKGRR